MPAEDLMDTRILPCYRLPENTKRLGEGGRRLLSGDRPEQRPVPEISVVTVVLNDGEHLEKTLQSVTTQLGERAEYILIDGGSTDNTLAVIGKYESFLEYWVSEPDLGISDAFNKGVALCRGRVVGVLNSGDWFAEQAFDLVENFFREKSDTGVLCGSLQYWLGDEKAYIAESRPELLCREMSVTHPTCFVQREIYLRHGGFNPAYKYAMDYELLLRFRVQGVLFRSVPQILAHMPHEGVSEQNWRKALEETWKARRQYVPGSFFAGRMYLWYLIVRKRIRFVLQALGMNGVVRFYRERLAPVRKSLPEE